MAEKTIKITVRRYRPEISPEPTDQTYVVPFRDDWVIVDALNYIKDEQDGSLSYRWSCRMGVCGSCGMNVNGEPKLTCATFLRDYASSEIRVEPLANFPVIRDLVTDITDFLEKLRRVKPWLIRKDEKPVSEGPYWQKPWRLKLYKQASLCINCTLCYAACPAYGLEKEFIGPAAIALAYRYNMDSRDQGEAERAPIIGSHDGIWHCSFVGECSEVCPKHVDPAATVQRSKAAVTNRRMLELIWPWGRK